MPGNHKLSPEKLDSLVERKRAAIREKNFARAYESYVQRCVSEITQAHAHVWVTELDLNRVPVSMPSNVHWETLKAVAEEAFYDLAEAKGYRTIVRNGKREGTADTSQLIALCREAYLPKSPTIVWPEGVKLALGCSEDVIEDGSVTAVAVKDARPKAPDIGKAVVTALVAYGMVKPEGARKAVRSRLVREAPILAPEVSVAAEKQWVPEVAHVVAAVDSGVPNGLETYLRTGRVPVPPAAGLVYT